LIQEISFFLILAKFYFQCSTKWGLNAQTLRTASLALVYSSAEYCAPIRLNSAHVHKLDVQLNNVMRLITGTVKSTELQWLPVLSNIAPPKLRREATLFRELQLTATLVIPVKRWTILLMTVQSMLSKTGCCLYMRLLQRRFSTCLT
jgi:hypothetical protein